MKLFNKFRFKMIEGKRLKNYVLYAIGEILLVVIGILIALYINDIQKNKNYEKSEAQLLKDVHAELIKDKADINAFIERIEQRNLSYAYFQKERPDNAEFPILYELDRATLKINPMISSSISNFNFKRGEISLKLTEILSNYKYAQKSIERLESEMNTIYTDYTNYLGSTYDWYTDFSFENHIVSESTDYFFNNKEYKAFIARLNTISSKTYIAELRAFSEYISTEIMNIRALKNK